MKRTQIFALSFLVSLLFNFPVFGFGQSEDEMMKAWKASIQPVEEHELMSKMAGEWVSSNAVWVTPDAPVQKTTGYAVKKMIIGDRYLTEEIKSESMGLPMEGRAVMAFDRNQNKFIYTWIDNFGTGIMVFEGESTGENQITLQTDYLEPMSGKNQVHIMVLTVENEKSHKMEYYLQAEDGKKVKTMEVVYRPAK